MMRVGMVLLATGLVGCGQTRALESRTRELAHVAARARSAGAYRCAPVELAHADAQLAFAKSELEQGNATRAREHLTLAAANAHAAVRLSADARCAERTSALPEAALSTVRARPPVPRALRNDMVRATGHHGSTRHHASI